MIMKGVIMKGVIMKGVIMKGVIRSAAAEFLQAFVAEEGEAQCHE